MGNLCRSETRQYKSLIAGVYPKDENDDRVQEGNLRKLTMCCLYNTNLLPQIGNRLEKLIRNDLQRKKIKYVLHVVVCCDLHVVYVVVSLLDAKRWME